MFMHNIFVGNCQKTMNKIVVRRYNTYSYSTFNYTLPYIIHTRFHNSILFSGPKKWNETMQNPYISMHLKKNSFKQI